jgi:3-oxoacyl-[acyl-carrier protein] reductase
MQNRAELANSIAVVTGGGRGIGHAISLKLAEKGATVVITGRSEQRLNEALQPLLHLSPNCAAVPCDLRDRDSVERLGRELREKFGSVNILVNNAGVGGPPSLLHELDPATWDNIFDTNVRGVFYMTRAIVPLMRVAGGGHIINISSLAGKNPLPRGAAYSASKWALNGLSHSMAEELRGNNIRVSVVCPGSVDTEFSPHPGKSAEKMLRGEDVAHVVAMLVTQRPQSFVSEVLLRPTQKP